MDASKMQDWESQFTGPIERLHPREKESAGVLLPIVPSPVEWAAFIGAIRNNWRTWQTDLSRYPACLIVLYSGVAFFRYDAGNFWEPFAEAVGVGQLSPNDQREINSKYSLALSQFGFTVGGHGGGTDFVGSAVHMIGIPLTLWSGFLDLCEWAYWRREFSTLSEDEWNDILTKRCGSRQRLKRFLSANRTATNALITEVLDARDFVASRPDLTIKDIAEVTILRPEYFEEVEDTAEFLRPQDPESLFASRPRLTFNEDRGKISLQLPAVSNEYLPATWHVDDLVEPAASSPHELSLDSRAFSESLCLTLSAENKTETQRLRGIGSWALFDMENGGTMVNPKRDELRLRAYALVSTKKLDMLREGFEADESVINQDFELTDGTRCYVTKLWPTGKYPELRVSDGPRAMRVIHFKTRNRIEVQFFVGWSYKSAYFYRDREGKLGMDHLPIPCVAIPNGYFRNNREALSNIFRVAIDDTASSGDWYQLPTASPDKEFWEWNWSRRPLLERISSSRSFKSFAEMGRAFKSADLGGVHSFAIKTGEVIRDQVTVNIIDRTKKSIDSCWANLPGPMLPLFLLSQSTEGLKWEELLLAKDVVAPREFLSRYVLHKYMRHGYVRLRGNRWLIRESRSELTPTSNETVTMNFCGDPSIVWGLYRFLGHRAANVDLPLIQVVNRRSEIPFMTMNWDMEAYPIVVRYLRRQQVIIGPILCSQ